MKRTTLVENALGSITVRTLKPSFLLVPTNMSLIVDPAPVAPTIEVDHYECYAAKVASSRRTFAVRKPSHLCAPSRTPSCSSDQVKPTVKNPAHSAERLDATKEERRCVPSRVTLQ